MHRLSMIVAWQVGCLFCCEVAPAQNIIAHRGASYDAPENTLAAFKLAWEQGADGIEADFYLSADGQVVCIHDENTERTAGVMHEVSKTNYDTLRTLDVGSWKNPNFKGERIPLCSEVFTTIPEGKTVVVELKSGPEIVGEVKNVFRGSALKPDQILVISFNEATIAECKRQIPNIRCHWLTGYKKNDEGRWKPDVDEVLETLRRTQADGLGTQAQPEHVDARFLIKLRNGGCHEFHVWTVDDPELARFYKQFEPWGITTNRPAWLREQLQTSADIRSAQ